MASASPSSAAAALQGGACAAPAAPASEATPSYPVFTDIAMNLDGMFEGRYNGKRHHEPDLAAVLARAAAAGVRRIILTGTNLEESRKALAFARAHNASGALPSLRLFSTVGLHPTCTAALELPPDELEAALLALALDGLADRTVVFIGECGLDFERLHFSPEAQQRRHFPMHLRLARRTGLPLFLHDRATHGALLALCAEHGGLPPAGGVVHSFTGTAAELAGMLAQPGLCIGLNGCGLKTAENCAVAATIPLQRLLLETDAPWCSLKASSPAFAHARRDLGRAVRREKWEAGALVKDRNEPCAVVHVAEAYAGLAGVPVERVAAEAEANLQRLLGAFM